MSEGFAETPEPPYVAVIFTSVRNAGDDEDYGAASAEMVALAREQPGFLGVESARSALGITVSYWVDEQSARAWKTVAEHRAMQRLGRERWYAGYRVRVATVTRAYGLTGQTTRAAPESARHGISSAEAQDQAVTRTQSTAMTAGKTVVESGGPPQ